MLISGKVTLNYPRALVSLRFNTIIMKTLFYILPVFLLITGCKSASNEAPERFTAASETGLAVGTITFENDIPKNDIYRFFYTGTTDNEKFNKQNKGKIEIKGRNAEGESDFSGDFANGQTYLFVIERQPGTYAFNQYNYLNRIGPTGMVSPSREFAIPFEIRRGEISYIGEFSYNDLAEPGNPKLVVYNRYRRDLEQLKKKYPGIDWNLATDKTVKSGNTGGGIIDFR